jgi:hypothetical protein
MPHIFFVNYLFRMYEIHAQYNWMFHLHMLFFHIFSIYVYGLTPAWNKDMCAFPCQLVSCSHSHILTARTMLSSSSDLVPCTVSLSGPKRWKSDGPRSGHILSPLLRIHLQLVCNECQDTDAIFMDCYSGAICMTTVYLHMCAVNISVATCQFSHCYLYFGMRK